MKKKYQSPLMQVIELTASKPLAEVSSDVGVGYGGVDEDGMLNPAVRQRRYEEWDWD